MRKIVFVRLFLVVVAFVLFCLFTGWWLNADNDVSSPAYASVLPVTPGVKGDNAVRLPTTWENVVVKPLGWEG